MFKDANKRVTTIIANKILIQNGKGLVSILVELDGKFKSLLVKYYETNNILEMKEWIYENRLDGINRLEKIYTYKKLNITIKLDKNIE